VPARLAKLLEQLGHGSGAEQLAGVRRDVPRGQHLQVALPPRLYGVRRVRLSDQHSGQGDRSFQALWVAIEGRRRSASTRSPENGLSATSGIRQHAGSRAPIGRFYAGCAGSEPTVW